MKALTRLPEKEDNPVKYLLCISLLFALVLFFPQLIGWWILLGATLAFLFVYRPFWGILFIIALHPVMSCSFDIFWTFGHPIEIISLKKLPYEGVFLSPVIKPLTVYPFQIVSLLLLPSLVIHAKPISAVTKNGHYRKIIYTAISFFFLYGLVISSQAIYADKSVFFLSRFASITIMILYLVYFVTSRDILRQVMIIQCCTALGLALLTYFGTYYGFENISYIWYDNGVGIIQRQSLYNGANSYNPETIGMLPGFGISAKHQFSTFLIAGIFFAAYLFSTTKNKAFSLFYLATLLILYMYLFFGPSKLSLVGIFIGVLSTIIFSPYFRRHIAIIVVLVLSLNIFGLAASTQIRPLHAKLTEGSTMNFKVVNDDSEFSMSFNGRLAIMRSAAKRIPQTFGLGIGSGMLSRDPLFPYVHGHNFFITLLAECGFPAVLCVITLGILLIIRVAPVIISQNFIYDSNSLAVVTLTASFIATFFEYMFDTFVWTPQLWILGSLLWISVNFAMVSKNCPFTSTKRLVNSK